MKRIFTALMVLFAVLVFLTYVKLNIFSMTGAVSAGISSVGSSPEKLAEQAPVFLQASTLFMVWAFLVLAVSIFFFIRIVRLGA